MENLRLESSPFFLLLLVLTALMFLPGCTGHRSEALVTQGDKYMLSGNYPAAVENYKKAQKLSATDQTHLRLASGYVKLASYDLAIKELSEIPSGTSAHADYLRAYCLLNLNDIAAAESYLETSLQNNPTDSLALALLGRIKFLQKQYLQSVKSYQQALNFTSDDNIRVKLYYNLAIGYLQAGQFRQADDNFKLYLTKQKFISAEDNKLAGAIAYSTGDHKRAVLHWQRLNSRDKEQILNTMAPESAVYQELATNY